MVIILTKEQKTQQLGICRPDSILHLSKQTGTYN